MFFIEYLKDPRRVGAVAPSGKQLTYKMIGGINFNKARCIVEYGSGTGVFTEKLLARVKEDTIVILFETNEEFYNELLSLYGHKKNLFSSFFKNINVDKTIFNLPPAYILKCK